MDKQEVQVVALSTSETSPGNFALVLETLNTGKRLAIIIGAFEAQAIAIHMERMQLPRPLTHDILKNTIVALNATLKEVVIYALLENMFHAWLVLHNTQQQEIKIDARASDAIALAIRFNATIYIAASLLEEVTIQEELKPQSLFKSSLAEYTVEELESLLRDVLAKEDYESATRIRDMISRRKQE